MTLIDALEAQLRRVIFYPESSLQWLILGGGGLILLLLYGKLFSGVCDIKKGFPAIVIGVGIAMLGALAALAITDLYLLEFTENRWVGRGITVVALTVILFVLSILSAKLILKNTPGGAFCFGVLVLFATWGTLFLVDSGMRTGESTGSQVDYWQERQRERMGHGLE